MNASDILMYGNRTVLMTIADVPEVEWDTGGVCGIWSVREIIAHLASFEHMLVEVLNLFLGEEQRPYLKSWAKSGQQFNDNQVAKRKTYSWEKVLNEYKTVHALTMELIAQIPVDTRRKVGTIPWYGAEYALDDLIVYAFYGHKREHCSQINVFKDKLKGRTGA